MPKRDGRHFVDGIFKYIFVKENFWISNIQLKYTSALVQLDAEQRQATV